ncbi:MAG TPA: amino acid ABC transporter permease [Methanocorpusculum sp.]|nr:amino acid ABC transporter permease [Methanocorpusculum sp.]
MSSEMLFGLIRTEPEFWTDVLLPAMAQGFLVTLELILIVAPLGLLLGILVSVLRVYAPKPISFLAKLYVLIFRGCPLIVLLFILYFGLPSVGILLEGFTAAVIGFVLCNSAYNSEYIRGALQSIKRGQLLAAQSLGMTKVQAIIHVIIPQALRRAIPGVSNEFIYMIKYTSLAYFVTVIETTMAAKMIALHYMAFIESFGIAALIYLAVVSLATFGVHKLEKKVAIPGYGPIKVEHPTFKLKKKPSSADTAK